MKLLRSLPIEIYAILIPSIILSFCVATFSPSSTQAGFIASSLSTWQLALLGGQKLFLIFIISWILLIGYIYSLRKSKSLSESFDAVISLIGLNIFASLITFLLGVLNSYLGGTVPLVKVISATSKLDMAEKFVFGQIPAIKLIDLFSGTLLERLFLYSYVYLFAIFSFTLLLLILSNKKIFRQTFMSFFLAFLIATPFFSLFPATSPDGYYIANTLSTNNYLYIQHSDIFDNFINLFHSMWIRPHFINISSIPSLHAAWGLIGVLGLLHSKNRFSGLFVIWLLFNLVGAMYSLQHYALDLIAGIITGLSSFYLAGYLIKLSNNYYEGFDWYVISDYLVKAKTDIRLRILKK
jgi:hypothetical protein